MPRLHRCCCIPCRLAALSLLALSMLAQAQAPAPEPFPHLALRVNGSVTAMMRHPDGGLILGGDFTWYDGEPRVGLARLRADGSLDPDWHPGATLGVTALAVDAAGSVYVAGYFDRIDAVPRRFLARIGDDGVVDPLWNPQPDGPVNALALHADALFAGGSFDTIGGASRMHLAKLSLTGSGSADANWDPQPSSTVFALALDGDGHVFVGGDFAMIGGSNRATVARVSTAGAGAVDLGFTATTNGSVSALALSGDDLFFGGSFFSVGVATPVQRRHLAKVHRSSGAVDAAWNPAPDDEVLALLADANGRLYVGGAFAEIGGIAQRVVARLATTGTGGVDAGWNPAPRSGVVQAIASDGAGALHLGGNFSVLGNAPRIGFARLDASGGAPIATDVEQDGAVHTIAITADGSSIVGGEFVRADGVTRRRLLRLAPNGTLDPLWAPAANGSVDSLAIDAGGSVYAAGSFTEVSGAPHVRLVKLAGSGSGAPDPNWQPPAPDQSVDALAIAGESLFVAGSFSALGATPRGGLAKLMLDDGALDALWNPGVDGRVTQMLPGPDETVFVAGSFTTIAGGALRPGLARLHTDDSGAVHGSWDARTDGSVCCIGLRGDVLYVGGLFSQVGGSNRAGLARLSTSGAGDADPQWSPVPSDQVTALLVGQDGVYVSGLFQSISGVNRQGLARLLDDAQGSVDPRWNPGMDGYATVLRELGDDIELGGPFVRVGSLPRGGLARLPRDRLLRDGFE